ESVAKRERPWRPPRDEGLSTVSSISSSRADGAPSAPSRERICAHLASSSEAAAGSVRVVSRWTERKGPDCSRTGVSQGSFTGDLQHARRAGSPTPSSASSPRLGPLNLSTRDRSPQAERHIAARPAAVPLAPLRPSCRCAPRTAPPVLPLCLSHRSALRGRTNFLHWAWPQRLYGLDSTPATRSSFCPARLRQACRPGRADRACRDCCACRAGLVRAALPGSLLRRLLLRGGFLQVADPGGASHLAPVAGQRRDV